VIVPIRRWFSMCPARQHIHERELNVGQFATDIQSPLMGDPPGQGGLFFVVTGGG
jgi:hypothetical protein